MAKLLVIDDDSRMRETLARVLTHARYEVIEAADGREGMMHFRIHAPALVVTDILMPDREGIETIREIRREAPTVPIIAISGGAGNAENALMFLEAAKRLGADATLTKPFRAKKILDVVNELLGAHNLKIAELRRLIEHYETLIRMSDDQIAMLRVMLDEARKSLATLESQQGG